MNRYDDDDVDLVKKPDAVSHNDSYTRSPIDSAPPRLAPVPGLSNRIPIPRIRIVQQADKKTSIVESSYTHIHATTIYP